MALLLFHLHLLLQLLLLTTTATARNTTNCSEAERQALLAIKTGIFDGHTRLSSWNGFACCSWSGVSCTAGRVVKLDLRKSGDYYMSPNVNSGNIPPWIGSCLSSLEVLRLRSNVLHGDIPVQLSLLTSLQVLDLGNNSLSGVLPPWLGNLTALQTIRQNMSAFSFMSFNNYYYQESLFVHAKGVELEYTSILSLVASIDMSSNKLTGEIPDGLTKLRGLIFLNFSGNHLEGRIPVGIGELKNLQSLDMSMNELSGSIPQSITSLDFLSVLILSNNNLSGPIPLGGQMSTFSQSSFINNVGLCGPPLEKKCSNDRPPNEGAEEDDDEDVDSSETLWIIIIGFAPGIVVGFWTFIGVTMIKSSTRYAYFQFIDRIINLCM